MAETDPKIQSRLIRDLEPAVAIEIERHIRTTREWYPHEYVPWSEGRTFAGPLNGDAWEAKDSKLTAVAQDSLVLNLLTEDNLPSYHTEIAFATSRDVAWNYQTPYPNDMLHTIAYVTFQELATRISHRNTGRISDDPICEGMLARVALDENLHMLFYRNLLAEAIKLEPNAAMRAITDVLVNFQMPGAGMPGWGRKSVQIALAGIYDLKLHLEDVVMPVLRAWGIFELTTLTGEGAKAREELAEFLKKASADVATFVDKREVHFERLIARGQEPLRLL